MLADLEVVLKRRERLAKDTKRGDKEALAEDAVLGKIEAVINEGRAVCFARILRVAFTTLSGYGEVTLTTFRDVPWNMPFSAALGFKEIPPGDMSPQLTAVVHGETGRVSTRCAGPSCGAEAWSKMSRHHG